MSAPLMAIARNTLRETIRDRVLNAILLFALVLIASALLLGSLSAGQDVKIVLDLGLAAISLFGTVIAVFIGASLVQKEVEYRTVFIVLTKPVPRSSFIFGKFLGLMGTMTLLVGAMGIAYLLQLLYLAVPIHLGLLQAIYFAWLQLMILTALSIMFSVFSSPVSCLLYSFGLFIIGHNVRTLYELIKDMGPGLKQLMLACYYLLPHFSEIDIKNQAVYGYQANPFQLAWGTLYAVAYCLAVLSVAVISFRQREF